MHPASRQRASAAAFAAYVDEAPASVGLTGGVAIPPLAFLAAADEHAPSKFLPEV